MSWPNTFSPTLKILTIIVSSLFGISFFLLFDFLVGNLLIPPPVKLEEMPYAEKDCGWYELKPNFSGFDQYGPLRFPVYTDANGFRKDASSVSHANYDVIFLGDSFTYGIIAAWEKTFVGIYSQMSKQRVINAGVTSYSPTPYLYQYKKALAASLLKAKHNVVVGIDMSDVQDEAGHWVDGTNHPQKRDEEIAFRRQQKEKAEANAIALQKQLKDKRKMVSFYVAKQMQFAEWAEKLTDKLPLTRTIYRYLRPERVPSNPFFYGDDIFERPRSAFTWADWKTLNEKPAYYGERGYAPLGVRGGLEKVELKLKEIMELGRKHDASIYFLIYPWPAQLHYEDKFNWSGYVKEMCERLSCSGVIDTIPRFRDIATADKDWYRKYYVYGDIHFNEAGNKIVAEEILKSLPAK
jgi:hypothetical protein